MTSTQNSGPLPTHVVTWHPDNYDGQDGIGAGQWLYSTKDTGPGDRQIVWSGIRGAGLVAVVDFQREVRPRSAQPAAGARRLYEGWARVTPLDRPLSVDEVKSHPVISRAFEHSIQGPQRLDPDIAAAIEDRLGGFPPAPSFNSHPPTGANSAAIGGRPDFRRRSSARRSSPTAEGSPASSDSTARSSDRRS